MMETKGGAVMGNCLNPGNEKLRRMIQSEIYVDKTARSALEEINERT